MDFRRRYLARSISIAGSAASAVALPLLIYRDSGSAGLTAAVTGLEAVPFLLFGLLAGAIADRVARRRLMICADLACAGLLAMLPLAGLAGLPRLGRRLGVGRLSIACYLLYLCTLPALAMTPIFGAALLLWLLWDFSSTMAITNGITLRQQLTPDELQGRVNTTGRMIAWGGTPFGALLGGLIADGTSATTAYLALAVPVSAGLAIVMSSPVRRLHSALPVEAEPAPATT